MSSWHTWRSHNDIDEAEVEVATSFGSWFPQSFFLFSLLSSPYIFDSAKLLILGSIIETGRRLCRWLFERFRFQYSITARFTKGDPAYEWIIHFLTSQNEQKVWQRSCDFNVSAKSASRKWGVQTGSGDSMNLQGNAVYVPTYEQPRLFRWRGYWLEVKRSEVGMPNRMPSSPFGGQAYGTVFVTIYTLNVSVLSNLVEEARLRYIEVSRPSVIVHMADTPHCDPVFPWTNTKCKLRRPLNSIILQDGVLESLLQDAKEFVDTEKWYVERGIPHRRGYLLHGPPGSGKSSTIYALAGELGMEIYSLSLASTFVDDSFLQRAASSIPKHSIFLLEDIDCAFRTREDDEDDRSMITGFNGRLGSSFMGMRRSPVTLSALLNVIDGVGSEEGKLFFATTNHVDRLDPALHRPGRIDRKIAYSLATKSQAAALFIHFFPNPKLSSSSPSNVPEDPVSLVTESEDNVSYAEHIAKLSETFASHVPSDEFSTAEIQGYLLGCKGQPDQAVVGVAGWVKQERREKEEAYERKAKEKRKPFMHPNTAPPAMTSGTSYLPSLLPNVQQTELVIAANDEKPLSPSPAYEASEGVGQPSSEKVALVISV